MPDLAMAVLKYGLGVRGPGVDPYVAKSEGKDEPHDHRGAATHHSLSSIVVEVPIGTLVFHGSLPPTSPFTGPSNRSVDDESDQPKTPVNPPAPPLLDCVSPCYDLSVGSTARV